MHIITRRKLLEFAADHLDAKGPLDAWFKVMSRVGFRNLMEIRAVFPATDDVQGLCVFNIGGNKFRLVAKVEYRWQKVFIKAVLTHEEYDRGAWKPKRGKK
jgi:mRNA interferase HigB